MSYLTLKEASEATGLNEATIRRLCKKPSSKPFIEMKKGKQGGMYTIQANYLFDIYPPVKSAQNPAYTRVYNDSTSLDKEPTQDYTALLSAKDEIIELLKSETAYLRAENTSLREENRELKLLPAASLPVDSLPTQSQVNPTPDQGKKSFWQRLFS
jgi:DNA-binding IscR family transcriptional regulator